MFFKISQNSRKSTCARVSFLIKLRNSVKKETLAQLFCCEFWEICKNTYFYRTSTVAKRKIPSVTHCNQVKKWRGRCTEKNLPSFTKYFRLILVFMWNSALRGKFSFCFSIVLCWYFYLAGGQGAGLLFCGI